jgi:hypothetical protein
MSGCTPAGLSLSAESFRQAGTRSFWRMKDVRVGRWLVRLFPAARAWRAVVGEVV